MSNVVQFLEALARNPKSLFGEAFNEAVACAGLEPASHQAMLARNADALNQALGGRLAMMCIVVPAENDEPQDDEEQGGDETPDSETSSRAA